MGMTAAVGRGREGDGRLCVVTGANSGIGNAMAHELARRGAQVVLVCRNPEKGEAARRRIVEATGNERVRLEVADLASLARVRDLAERLSRFERVDVLLNNAGLYLPARQVSADGFEMMFAVNHLAPFLLTNLLLERLARSPDARVITTSSVGHRFARLDLEDLQAERRFSSFGQYGATKLENILFTREAARRFSGQGIAVHCFHPGAVGTGFAQDEPGALNALMKLGKVFIRTPEQGADTGVYLATSPEVASQTGEYYVNRRPRTPSRRARDGELARELWERSAQLAGIA